MEEKTWEFEWPEANKSQECDEATKEKKRKKKEPKGIWHCLDRNTVFSLFYVFDNQS